MPELTLTPAQARALAALVEKSVTTPAYYPMTVNGLTAACNQKNGRNPVMKLTEGEVGAALLDLAEMKLAERDDTTGRAPKWHHRFGHELLVPAPVLAVLAALMLRGPQTVAEIRAHAAPLNGPDDPAGVHQALERLADRAQPLVKELPKAPGQAAARWAHLLSGEPEIPDTPAPRAARPVPDEIAALAERVDRLEAELAELRAALGIEATASGSSPSS